MYHNSNVDATGYQPFQNYLNQPDNNQFYNNSNQICNNVKSFNKNQLYSDEVVDAHEMPSCQDKRIVNPYETYHQYEWYDEYLDKLNSKPKLNSPTYLSNVVSFIEALNLFSNVSFLCDLNQLRMEM